MTTDPELQVRGEYWIERLANEYHLRVPRSRDYRFRFADLGPHYGLTHLLTHVIEVHVGLASLDVALLDEMLVHELVHATRPPGAVHGPEFRRRYAKVYPWSRPGPVTEHDPGTPRRELWRRLNRELPLAGRIPD